MLADFIRLHQADLIALCVARAARRAGAAQPEGRSGTRPFLEALPAALGTARSLGLADTDAIAARHGMEMLANGAPLEWVVHEYGDVCQAIMQLSQRRKTAISVRDFEALNGCLDDAIAAAVSEYAHQRELLASRESSKTMHECLGRLADELRVPLAEGNLNGLRGVIDRSLAMIRLRSGMTASPEAIAVANLISELSAWVQMETQATGCRLVIAPVSAQLAVYADRALLVSALKHVLAAACRSSARKDRIVLRVLASDSRVLIEVQEGLVRAKGRVARLPARPVELRATPRDVPGREHAFVERSVRDNGGRLRIRELPGGERMYTIDLPRERMSAQA